MQRKNVGVENIQSFLKMEGTQDRKLFRKARIDARAFGVPRLLVSQVASEGLRVVKEALIVHETMDTWSRRVRRAN